MSKQDLQTYCTELGARARAAGRTLAATDGATRCAVLHAVADQIDQRAGDLISANAKDLARAAELGLTDAMVDRLRIDEPRIARMSASVCQIAEQIDPVGQIIEGYVRPNGLRLAKVRVPLGVVLIIYESRPNVTSDAAALCLKSGNAVVLRGGKEAIHSNTAIAQAVRDTLEQQQLDPDAVQLVSTTDRAAVGHLLQMVGVIDLAIPRGGESLIRAVVEQAHIPVIKHYAGNCHVYVDACAVNLPKAMVVDLCVNAKVQRPGVCNAAETILFHEAVMPLMKKTCAALVEQGVQLRACPVSMRLLESVVAKGQLVAAEEADWAREFLDLTLAVKVVTSLRDAVEHVNRYGSQHTDAIITADLRAADAFVQQVDTANVMVNCSTRFSDGGEYGLGAEIGISTDKLHARGPMGAADLTTHKWVVRGEGQLRQ